MLVEPYVIYTELYFIDFYEHATTRRETTNSIPIIKLIISMKSGIKNV